MASHITNEDVFILPQNVVLQSPSGFAIDMGGSVAKIVYRAKEDTADNHSKTGPGKLRCKCFAKDELDIIIEFLKQNVDFSDGWEDSDIVVTGIGCFTNINKLKTTFKGRVKLTDEVCCYLTGLSVFTKPGFEQACLPLPATDIAKGQERITKQKKLEEVLANIPQFETRDTQAESFMNLDAPAACVQYPCLLVLCSSSVAIFAIDKDGKNKYVDHNFRGGKGLLGICRLLYGAKDFNTLMSMAERGNHLNVDDTSTDIQKLADNQEDNFYKDYPADVPVFTLGKPSHDNNLTKYNPDDVLRSLVNMWTCDLVNQAQLLALLYNLPRVIFAGGFVEHPLIRGHITEHFMMRNYLFREMKKLEFQFINHPKYMCCLGAYLQQKAGEKQS